MDATIFFFFSLKTLPWSIVILQVLPYCSAQMSIQKELFVLIPCIYSLFIYFHMHFSSIFPLFWQRSLIVSRFFYIYIDHSRAFGTVDHFLEKATIIDLLKLHLGTSFFLILFLAHLFLDLCRWWDVSVGSGLLPTSCTVFGFIPMAFLPFKCWFKMFYLFHPDISRTSNFYICKLCTRHLSL